MSWPILGDLERAPITEEAAMQLHEDVLRQLVAVLESDRAPTGRERSAAAWYLRSLIERTAARLELIVERRPRGRPEGRRRHMALHLIVLTALKGEREARRTVKDVWSVSSPQVAKFADWARAEVEYCVKRCLQYPTTHLRDGALVLRTWTDEHEVLIAMDDYLRGLAEQRK